MPTISIDVVDAVELYLSQQALEQASIVSSKSSAVNISVPNAKGDYVSLLTLSSSFCYCIRIVPELTRSLFDCTNRHYLFACTPPPLTVHFVFFFSLFLSFFLQVEHPIPEQFLTKWDGKGFKTEPISKS